LNVPGGLFQTSPSFSFQSGQASPWLRAMFEPTFTQVNSSATAPIQITSIPAVPGAVISFMDIYFQKSLAVIHSASPFLRLFIGPAPGPAGLVGVTANIVTNINTLPHEICRSVTGSSFAPNAVTSLAGHPAFMVWNSDVTGGDPANRYRLDVIYRYVFIF
jgi:hypothetical protein